MTSRPQERSSRHRRYPRASGRTLLPALRDCAQAGAKVAAIGLTLAGTASDGRAFPTACYTPLTVISSSR